MNTYTDDYGFTNYEVTTENGGRVLICDYRSETDKQTDIGLFSMMNENGLGFSNYIRNKKAVDNFISKIDRIVWINEDQNNFLKAAIKTFKGENK